MMRTRILEATLDLCRRGAPNGTCESCNCTEGECLECILEIIDKRAEGRVDYDE